MQLILSPAQSRLLASLAEDQNTRLDILLDQAIDLLVEVYRDRTIDQDHLLTSLSDPPL